MTAVADQVRTADQVLADSRELVQPALRAAVDALPAAARRVAGYHAGWWDRNGRPVSDGGGKALRPALVLLAAEAAGGTADAAVPAAVAVELVHDSSLLHDDVVDGDATRRHRPTAWRVYGQAAAIFAGDALLARALEELASSGHPAVPEAMRRLTGAVVELLGGQFADLEFETRTDVGLAECVGMAAAKTGALLGTACALGALYGGGPSGLVERLYDFGRRVGLAFQHVDDLLGIWGDPAVTGKPVGSDLRTRKKSLPVVAALRRGGPDGRELRALLRSGRRLTGTETARAAVLVDRLGGRAWSLAQARQLLTEANRHLAAAAASPRATAELDRLAQLVIRRDH